MMFSDKYKFPDLFSIWRKLRVSTEGEMWPLVNFLIELIAVLFGLIRCLENIVVEFFSLLQQLTFRKLVRKIVISRQRFFINRHRVARLWCLFC